MCFGGSKSSPVPAPTPATTFNYAPADTSNRQQQQAAIMSSSTQPAAFGSDLGSGGSSKLDGTSSAVPSTKQY